MLWTLTVVLVSNSSNSYGGNTISNNTLSLRLLIFIFCVINRGSFRKQFRLLFITFPPSTEMMVGNFPTMGNPFPFICLQLLTNTYSNCSPYNCARSHEQSPLCLLEIYSTIRSSRCVCRCVSLIHKDVKFFSRHFQLLRHFLLLFLVSFRAASLCCYANLSSAISRSCVSSRPLVGPTRSLLPPLLS